MSIIKFASTFYERKEIFLEDMGRNRKCTSWLIGLMGNPELNWLELINSEH